MIANHSIAEYQPAGAYPRDLALLVQQRWAEVPHEKREQAKATADHPGELSELGLSIALSAARANSADLYVRDIPGKVCVFTIDLPRARSPSI